ncbi:PH domain-containing protein [Kitasatospora sp. NPDC058063]|uniref:PH domain-containing protein n=1 Tax=unclassified Kitasatospora TaxID=2633591 RepID=UPI0036D8641E
MNELIFRGKDKFRPSWTDFALLAIVVAAQVLIGYKRLGLTPMLLLVAGTLLLAVPGRASARRCWSRVDAEGITVCWGFGRGRTYSWQEIRWIDVRETTGFGTGTRAARLHTVDGRRRSLPALQSSTFYPSSDFDVDFRRVVNWWKHSTDPSRRVPPQHQARDRMTPRTIGVLGTVVLGLVVFAGVVLQQR